MKKLYRGPYIDAFCQVWFHLVQLFQRSRLKYEKLTVRSSIKLLHLIPFGQQTWPLLLKIEHRVKLHSIWPSSFRGEDFLTLANQKQELPLAAIFVGGMG
jgi:hypothetical protein